MKSLQRLQHIGRVVGLCFFFVTPAFALVLISESRSVFVSYYGSGIETISSDGTFGLFSASAHGIPFGGGGVSASQTSNITPSGFDLRHGVVDAYGPGAVAESNFSLTFQLNQPTPISITGYSAYFSGYAFLNGTALTWTGPNGVKDPYNYNNYLNFDQVLGAGTYTFTSYEWMRGDGISTRISLRDQSVPDGGSSAWMLAIGLTFLAAIRRRLT